MLASGLLEKIGESSSLLKHRAENDDGESIESRHEIEAGDHRAAFAHIAGILRSTGVFADGAGPDAIGHRAVHGGEAFSATVLINPEIIASKRKLIPLAPLHNPANLIDIESCLEAFPWVPPVAVFDTAFHQTQPPSGKNELHLIWPCSTWPAALSPGALQVYWDRLLVAFYAGEFIQLKRLSDVRGIRKLDPRELGRMQVRAHGSIIFLRLRLGRTIKSVQKSYI